MLTINWNYIKKLLGSYQWKWPFKNKRNFIFFQFLRCLFYSYAINIPIPLVLHFYCKDQSSISYQFYLFGYNVVFLILIICGTYQNIIKYKKLD